MTEMPHIGHIVTTLIFASVVLGAMYQALQDPKAANALLAAGADTYTGVERSLRG